MGKALRHLATVAKSSWKKAKPYVKKAWAKAKPYAKIAGKIALKKGSEKANEYIAKKTNKGDIKSTALRAVGYAAVGKGSSYATSKLS